MTLHAELAQTGSWLFRYRSFLPLGLLPIFLFSLGSFRYVANSHEANEYWQVLCLAISMTGMVVRILTVGHAPAGTSGRNTKCQIASELNTTGMYSLVRHPLYLGNYLIFLGFVMFFHSWWLVLLMSVTYALYYERIMLAEESFLQQKFGQRFAVWAESTPAFLPRHVVWTTPSLPFCWRTVLRREYSGLFLVTAVFTALDIVADTFVEDRLVIDWRWCLVFAVGLSLYLLLRTLKKQTSVLHVAGR